MRARGINYDTAFYPDGNSSRKTFDPEVVRREMRVIADELHCTAVRVSGGDPDRLGVAAEHAAAAGLEVWFAPFPCELTTEEMLPVLRRVRRARGGRTADRGRGRLRHGLRGQRLRQGLPAGRHAHGTG